MPKRGGHCALLCAASLFGSACGWGDVAFDQLAEVDPQSVPDNPTWTNDVRPRLDFYCSSCHSDDSPGGPRADLDLSVYDNAVGAFLVIERVVVMENSMPPGARPKLNARDWAILAQWRDRGFPE